MAKIVEAYTLSKGSGKETNHYIVSIKGSGLRYKTGDAMGFFPKNKRLLVVNYIQTEPRMYQLILLI